MSRLRVICSLVSIVTFLVGFSVRTAQGAIVPKLTGIGTGSADIITVACGPNDDPGQASALGADITIGISSGWGISSSITSVTGSNDLNGLNGSCHYTWSGTTDGPITGTFENLRFTGKVTGGTFDATTGLACEGGVCDSFGTGGTFTAPFKGFWNNGWYSTGTLSGSSSGFDNVASLNITTVTPEPSTFMMLGAGLLPVIGVIRRRYLNR